VPGAEVSLDQVGLLKTMRWYDGFVIGMACPGFILVGIAGSVLTLGPVWASTLWFLSALAGALAAYIYSEPAAMFPDKSGGLSMYAKEGWRAHFSLAGPIATFGYWFAWSSVLAIYGGIIGILLSEQFLSESAKAWSVSVLFFDVNWWRLIGAACILACFLFNYYGMRTAVWFSYATGFLMSIPVICLAVIPIVTGKLGNGNIDWSYNTDIIRENVAFYGGTPGTWSTIAMAVVWFWVIAWSTYGSEAPATFAPEYHDTKNDTRIAIASTGGLNVVLSLILPLTVTAIVGYNVILEDPTYIAYLATALNDIVGDSLGKIFTVFVCAGLLLSMNTATMDGSRALYGMSKEGLTIKWLSKLNRQNVPGRAMALDMVLNLALLFFLPTLLFTLLAGNIGYVVSHIFALSGFLLLRKYRGSWPRPLKLGSAWIGIAWIVLAANIVATIFGVAYMQYTGYLIKGDDVLGYRNLAIGIGLCVLAVAVIGYIVGQKQAGRPFSFRDKSEEQPDPHVYELMGTSAPSGD
jgi:amino acid transporter